MKLSDDTKNILLYGIGGIILIVVIACAGCGTVTPADLEPDAGAAGTLAEGGSAGASAGASGSAGMMGTAGAGGTAGTTGAAGSPPLPCVPDACGACMNGVRVPADDGTACGDTMCSGEMRPTGFPSGDTYRSSSDSHTCKAGVCVAKTTTCDNVFCPSTCRLKYRGCITDKCWCVDIDGAVCPS